MSCLKVKVSLSTARPVSRAVVIGIQGHSHTFALLSYVLSTPYTYIGSHLSLGSTTIAQHGKSSSRERPGAGGALGVSFASVALAARAAALKNKHGVTSPGGGGGQGGEENVKMPAETYWEYESDSLVHASCEDNSDAEVCVYVRPAYSHVFHSEPIDYYPLLCISSSYTGLSCLSCQAYSH